MVISLDLKSLFISEKCDVVAFESASDFCFSVHDSLIMNLSAIIKNARDLKELNTKNR